MADAVVPPPLPPEPPPVPGRARLGRAQLVSAVAAVVFTAAIGIGAAFGFDVCQALASVGVHADACQAHP